jgi:hypothetical protein
MSKYRCPICGSPHREPVAKCRQCGASMLEDSQVPIITKAPRNTEGDRLKPRSILPFVLGGILIVALIAAGAVALGLIDSGDEVDTVVNRVVPSDGGDGWIVFEEPNGVFTAETPGELEVDTTLLPLTDSGSTVHYSKQINDQLKVMISYTEGADLDTADPYATLDPIAQKLAGSWNGKIFGEPTETSLGGRPAVNFVVDEITIDSVPYELYCRLALLEDGDVLLVATLATGEPPDQQPRMLESVVIAGSGGATTDTDTEG